MHASIAQGGNQTMNKALSRDNPMLNVNDRIAPNNEL